MFEWLTSTMMKLGYLGIGALMLLENILPPIPSEIVMPLGGFAVARGEMSFAGVVAVGTVGSLLGTLAWYFLGRWMGEKRLGEWADRYGRWLGLSSKSVAKASGWFTRHGEAAVFFGRLVPGVRTYISLPAGASGMPLVPFLFYSLLGTALWTGLLTYAGMTLGDHYHLVERYMAPIGVTVLVALGLWAVVNIVRSRQKKS